MKINLEGLIPVFGGVFAWLIATGRYIPSRDPEKFEQWRLKWESKLKILAPLVILFGIAQLLGFL